MNPRSFFNFHKFPAEPTSSDWCNIPRNQMRLFLFVLAAHLANQCLNSALSRGAEDGGMRT